MIILTGPDNTGKTTLAQRLSEATGLEVIPKFNGKPWEERDEWFLWLYKHCREAKKGGTFIADRLFIDDLVYGPIIRGGLTLEASQRDIIENMLIDSDPLIIITNLPVEQIMETFHEREQYPKSSDMDKLVKGFDQLQDLWPYCDMRIVTYNYRTDDFDLLLKMVREYIEGRAKR